MEILEPIRIKNVDFKNRVVMAPMVPFGMPIQPSGSMSDKVLQHYLQRASNGMGLIITQAFSVTSRKKHDGGIGVYSDDHKAYLKTLTKVYHAEGTRIFVQLAYPSAGFHRGDSINDLSEYDIKTIKDEFVYAAKLCKEAGCDGIELHGAHGFFLNIMASSLANKREDQYGGDLDGRLRLVKNIVEEIRTFADEPFIISYRMGWNGSLENDIRMAQALERGGIELLHISSGIPAVRKMEIPDEFFFNEIVYTGIQIKKNVSIPVIVVNDIRTLSRGNYLIENGLCDFAAYGRPFLADAAFMTTSLNNCDYEPCLRCKTCQWFINGEKCPAKINGVG
nr:tRNA-dihydrouridine synthase [Methylomusa anaerophila]